MTKIGDIKRGSASNNYLRTIYHECLKCKRKKWIVLSSTKRKSYTGLCSPCAIRRKGKENKLWRGRQKIQGYILVYADGHPLSNKRGLILEHRLVASTEWGIDAVMGMVVHHINGNITDNRIENLEILSRSEHTKLHSRSKSK